jgi:LysM repeat protein
MALAPAQSASKSVFSTLRTQRALYAPVLAIVAFGLVACSGKPENSPVIRKKFAEVDAMKEELSTAIAELRTATGQMNALREQVSELRAFAPDGEGASAIVSRIEAIENRLTALTTTATQQRTVAAGSTGTAPATTTSGNTAASGSSFGGLATPATTTAAAAPATSAPATSGTSTAASTPGNSFRDMTNPNRPAATSPATSTQAPRTQTAAARPATPPAQAGTGATAPTTQSQPANRGRYYTIETGDTLEKIARDNNVSVDALREANRLPAGARPLKGQRLFIPPAK